VTELLIGTSGYSYEDWKGNFYPSDLNSSDFLYYYSGIFNTVELNFTYYKFPNPYTFLSLLKKVSKKDKFVFSVKANSKFTHEREFTGKDSKEFLSALKPLLDAGSLGSILFQFPYSFYFNTENTSYIDKIKEHFGDYEISFEFRNNKWLNNVVIKKLSELNIGFCNVDEPQLKGLLPPTEICTSDNGYMRFHGRNSRYWWRHEHAYQRYDYSYKQEELSQWVPKAKNILEKTKKTYIYFNNHYKGKAVKSALLFLDLLKNNNPHTSQN
jgi:uncharacterized protein YecE (DUF72 family)